MKLHNWQEKNYIAAYHKKLKSLFLGKRALFLSDSLKDILRDRKKSKQGSSPVN